MTAGAASGAGCASPMLRDRFLNALDASDDVALRDLARQLTVDDKGNVYVADSRNRRVQKFSRSSITAAGR